MTQITLKTNEYGKQELRINRRMISYNGKFDAIEKSGSYTWKGQHRGHNFVIWGGSKSGGASNQWFVQYDAVGQHDMACRSAADCVRLIENC